MDNLVDYVAQHWGTDRLGSIEADYLGCFGMADFDREEHFEDCNS